MAISRRKCFLAAVVSFLIIANLSYMFSPRLQAIYLSNDRQSELSFVHSNHKEEDEISDGVASLSSNSSNSRKPWPFLPSGVPWNHPSGVISGSCEGYFGNGFTESAAIFPRNSSDSFRFDKKLHAIKRERIHKDSESPSLQCFYSETLRTSLCEGRKIVIHPGRIHMSAGGEALDSVVGRTDAQELPSFSPGAFEIIVPPVLASDWTISEQLLNFILPQGHINDHRLRSLFSNIRTINSNDVKCSQRVKSSTLLVIRYEYANLFHTATDWYSGYVASRVLSLPNRPDVVFVDGHCQSPMDDGWKALFGDVKYAKSFTDSVCFDHLIFTPLGYETALFKGLNTGIPCKGCEPSEIKKIEDDGKTARLREFGEMFKSAFGVVNKRVKKSINILFVRRESYLAHPRHSGKPETRLANEQELFDSMEKWAQSESLNFKRWGKKINILNGTLAHMKMKEQVQAVDDASVIVGVHGAGLTHILFARPGTIVLELTSPLFLRPHYAHISEWMGFKYHSVRMRETVANCEEVLQKLSTILDDLI